LIILQSLNHKLLKLIYHILLLIKLLLSIISINKEENKILRKK